MLKTSYLVQPFGQIENWIFSGRLACASKDFHPQDLKVKRITHGLIYHFNVQQIPFLVPEHELSVCSTWDM